MTLLRLDSGLKRRLRDCMPRKPSQQRERRYVVEYVNERFPDRRSAVYNAMVGPAPEELVKMHPEVSLQHFRRWRFYVDAVVVMEDRLILVETKLRKPDRGIGALLMYKPLVKETPELKPYADLPLELLLVTPRPDPRVIAVAAANGIKVDVYAPDWVMEYLRELGMA